VRKVKKVHVYDVLAEVVKQVPSFFIKKDGTAINAIWLKNYKHPFVDWKGKIKTLPNVSTRVFVIWHNWTQFGQKGIGTHHVIDYYSAESNPSLSKTEVIAH
jgi:hypothetical protein